MISEAFDKENKSLGYSVAEQLVTEEEGKEIKVVARVFSPFKYDNDTRCDLHPRWSPDGKQICFDGTFEGHRGLYVVKL